MKLLKCKVYVKEMKTKKGVKFNTYFIAFKNKEGERATMDCKIAQSAIKDFNTLIGNDKNLDLKLTCGQGGDDWKTQDCFVTYKKDEDGKEIHNKLGNPIKQLIIVRIGSENLCKDLDLPQLEHKDLTEDW